MRSSSAQDSSSGQLDKTDHSCLPNIFGGVGGLRLPMCLLENLKEIHKNKIGENIITMKLRCMNGCEARPYRSME